MKISWNKDSHKNARLAVSDGVATNYVSEAQLLDGREEFTMLEVAESYAATYDRNGNDDGYVVAQIEDLADGETINFAFDGHGNFELATVRDFIHS